MIDRKKKLRFFQFSLLGLGILIIYLTYYNKDQSAQDEIISKKLDIKIQENKKKTDQSEKDMFFNIEYTGLDFNGNRYLLKAGEASLDDSKPEIVYMNVVEAIFYFKDGTKLYIWSNKEFITINL